MPLTETMDSECAENQSFDMNDYLKREAAAAEDAPFYQHHAEGRMANRRLQPSHRQPLNLHPVSPPRPNVSGSVPGPVTTRRARHPPTRSATYSNECLGTPSKNSSGDDCCLLSGVK